MMTDARSADGDHAQRLCPPHGRRGLLATGLALGRAAAANAALAAVPPVAVTGTQPGSATALSKKLLPGFEQRFIRTEGTQVDGVMAEGSSTRWSAATDHR